MELVPKKQSACPSLIHWLLDHHHFLLFSFFTSAELEDILPLVSHKFSQKVMSIALWKEMMDQLSGALLGPPVRAEENFAPENFASSFHDFEDQETEDLLASSAIIDIPRETGGSKNSSRVKIDDISGSDEKKEEERVRGNDKIYEEDKYEHSNELSTMPSPDFQDSRELNVSIPYKL